MYNQCEKCTRATVTLPGFSEPETVCWTQGRSILDLSKDYTAKVSTAISSALWGITTSDHTGLYQVGPSGLTKTFCSLSDSLEHGPGAIGAHLDPVIDEIKAFHPEVSALHFYSDGPTTYYRQWGNFYKFSTVIHTKGLKGGTWNFSEVGHNKGTSDGVGATLKKTGDSIVAHGTDIPDGLCLYEQLQKIHTSVPLFCQSSDDIDEAVEGAKMMKTALPVVPAMMKIHQLVKSATGKLDYRDVSCMCTNGRKCTCQIKSFAFNLYKEKKMLQNQKGKIQ